MHIGQSVEGVVKIRRDIGLEVKPEAEAMDGKRLTFTVLWQFESDDSRYPNEFALGTPHEFDLTWIASGDVSCC